MTKTAIRERHADDLQECVKSLHQVHLADGYPMVWPRDPIHWLSPAQARHAWVAVADDGDRPGSSSPAGVLGHVLLCATASPRILEIARLFVPPAARGLGLGAALIEHAGVRAAQLDCDLELEVVADERSHAIALYERTGWRRVGTATAEWTAPDGGCVQVHRYAR